MRLFVFFVIVSVVALAAGPAYGQVTLAPTFVYVESPANHGTVMLTNTSSSVQEVFLDFEFGYPAADAAGHRYLEYDDGDAEAMHSLSPWVRSFPEQIRIPPRHRQLVRLMIDAPRELRQGIYWTRLVVTSREEAAPGAHATAQVNFEFRQIIPVVLDRGARSTDVEIDELVVEPNSRHVDLLAVLNRTGDAPFFGTLELRVLDEAGREMEQMSTTTDAYFRSSTVFTIARRDLPSGRYVAEVTARPERGDVRSGDVPAMAPVTRRFTIEIPDALTSEAR